MHKMQTEILLSAVLLLVVGVAGAMMGKESTTKHPTARILQLRAVPVGVRPGQGAFI